MILSLSDSNAIDSLPALLGLFGPVGTLAAAKSIPRLDAHCRRFIALSPFLVIGSTDREGRADTSPKGDPPGFVRVVDDRTIAIPDRPGNNRIDTLRNIVENPEVAVIFFVPGIEETLRLNGRARLTTDPELRATMAVGGKVPALAIVVEIREAYLHCAKALKRARLWDPDSRVARDALPSLGRMVLDQTGLAEPIAAVEARIEQSYRDRLY
jgi:PPOX class probable FMN-dependent enzyme